MSGLTLCFMSISLVDLEVLANSGTPKDRLYAMKILPLVKRRHLLLCSLLIFNGAAMESGKGGELSREETTIIAGALELTEKTARDSMTPISETFAIDIDAKLDRKLINLIFAKGNSRVPVYHGQPRNIIGLILVKNLLTIHPTDEVPVKNITIRQIPRFSETMPLYDILNEFQKGLSHMAVVVTQHNKMEQPASKYVANDSMREMRVDIHSERHPPKKRLKSKRLLAKLKISPRSAKISSREASKSRRWADEIHPEVLHMDDNLLSTLTKEGEVIGIITMQDVIEELLKEEIYDGTDHCDEHSQSNFF
ncbi:hypothetical protein F0562_002649 [Nyssa sinensis]|uniref:CNNM transmembrane domain-containing protein n=1 Tax=Nyssa sinensis TaxID=561372 RepID=A0A5J5BY99_9ASTE|nr:hypothetical protein F0562_002649 [Nyssa sinensis]